MVGEEILEQNVPNGVRRLEHPLGYDIGCVVVEDCLRPPAEISEGFEMALEESGRGRIGRELYETGP
jgi:hypothetical protein